MKKLFFKVKRPYLIVFAIFAFGCFGFYLVFGKKVYERIVSTLQDDGCYYDGKRYPKESAFRNESDCTVCVCRSDGTLKCIKEDCSTGDIKTDVNDENCELCEPSSKLN